MDAVNFINGPLWRFSKPGLERTRRLLELLGSPDKRGRFIHVAGTNGKGSTCAMLAAVLTRAGYKTGLYTSPFIPDFCEHIQIDGRAISPAALDAIAGKLAPIAHGMADAPTKFELVTAVALEHFAAENCDVAVLETGMGGRDDATNAIAAPLMSIITNIGLDHTRELGDTPEQIAAQKAGIIKPPRPVVCYDLPSDIRAVIEKKCRETASPLRVADFGQIMPLAGDRHGQTFSYKSFENLFLPLLGAHQLENAAVALEAVLLLRELGFEISDLPVRRGLEETLWPSRFEVISERPLFIADGGHNVQCAEAVTAALRRGFADMRTVILFGSLADKDYRGMAERLNAVADCFVTITPPSGRALSAEALAESLKSLGKPVFPCETITGGIERALELAGEAGLVCAFGSLYSTGTIRAYFGLET